MIFRVNVGCLKKYVLIPSKHFLFMLGVSCFWKLQHSGIFEARTKKMDFSVLAMLYTTDKERQKVCQWQPCHSLALWFPWRSPDVKADRELCHRGHESHHAQLDEIAVCLLHKHVRTPVC